MSLYFVGVVGADNASKFFIEGCCCPLMFVFDFGDKPCLLGQPRKVALDYLAVSLLLPQCLISGR